MRTAYPDPDGFDNPIFRSVNRNKRSIVLDLRSEQGKSVIYNLVRKSDVVVSNFRAGVIERMGFGYARLSEINPRIICAVGTGFGQEGPLAHKGGQDNLAQAISGVIARRANDDDPVSIYATALCDYTAGMHLVQGVLLALLQREKTGRGQQIAVSLFASMLAMQMQEAAMWMHRRHRLNWVAFPLTGAFETSDGAVVLVDAFKENPLRDICAALGVPDLSLEARYATLEGQFEHRADLQALLRRNFKTNTTAYWIERLEAQDLLCAPVLSLEEALDHEQTRINGTIIEGSEVMPGRFIGSPVTMAEGAFRMRFGAPRHGEHTHAVLREIGYDEAKIAALRSARVVS
jgi:formyl-CoA transferase